MYDLKNKQMYVIGLGARGRAACELGQHRGANLAAVDRANQGALCDEAGGRHKKLDSHYAGPLRSRRVKRAFLIGAAPGRICASWSLFTPCTALGSLLEAVNQAAENAVPGDAVLLSPACSSFDQFRNYQHRGEVFRQLVTQRSSLARVPAQSGINQTDNDEE